MSPVAGEASKEMEEERREGEGRGVHGRGQKSRAEDEAFLLVTYLLNVMETKLFAFPTSPSTSSRLPAEQSSSPTIATPSPDRMFPLLSALLPGDTLRSQMRWRGPNAESNLGDKHALSVWVLLQDEAKWLLELRGDQVSACTTRSTLPPSLPPLPPSSMAVFKSVTM
eukprot:758714-Hanusia_phi.AAC.5